ncbi:MAG: adenylyl-sulfate kinase [bacterium]|nr:adenylyl-sulfate kinase [bacterium]
MADRYARLGNLLANQGFFVIVSTVSMFDDIRLWNRQNNKNYLEIYLKVPIEERCARDPKNLYASGQDMIEFDKGYEEPKNPDLTFCSHQKFSPKEIAHKIFQKLQEV